MGISYNTSAFTTDGLLFYFDAANPASYSGSGTSWRDLSNVQNHATISGSPSYGTTNGGYFTFDGTGSQYATLTASKLNVPYTGKTVHVIARFNSSTWAPGVARFRCLYGNGIIASGRNFNTYLYHTSANEIKLYYITGNASDPVSIVDNQWFIMTVTQTVDTIYFYLNGVAVGTVTGSVLAQYKSTYPTERIAYADTYWLGDIASVAVYSRALSATEVQQNFTTHRARYGL